jgi:glycosyltransferase involved in cell wall biosynthesis
VTVLSSLAEGGAHVVGEAAVAGVPVLASRIPGNVGLLGASYPGYFPVRDTGALAALLARFETDAAFRARLREGVRRIAPLFDPARERRAWRDLLAERSRGREP